MSSCPQDTCSIAPRQTSSGWEFLLQGVGNQLPDGSTAYPRTCEWPAGVSTANNGLKFTAAGCPWVAPAAFGVQGCAEDFTTRGVTITSDSAGNFGPPVSLTVTNDTPYTQTGTRTVWMGPTTYNMPAGSTYAAGLGTTVLAEQCGDPYPPTGTTFPFIDAANPPTGAAPLTGDALCCVYPFVIDAYKAVIGRYPDAGALAFFTNQVANGGLQTADALYDNIGDVGANNNETYAGCFTTDGFSRTVCVSMPPGATLTTEFTPDWTAVHRSGVRGRIEVQGYGVSTQLQPVNPGFDC